MLFFSIGFLRKASEMSLLNQKIGNLFVLSKIKENGKDYYVCRCDCGNTVRVRTDYIKQKKDLSCGCMSKEKFNDIIGKKFNKITVKRYIGKKKNHHMYECECECGKVCFAERNHIISGHTKSCGCYKKEATRKINGLGKTRLHSIWNSMHARCYCKTHKDYHIYNKLGICKEWNSKNKHQGFLNFYEWAKNNGYDDSLTIDRIDNDKGYSPENCRWVTPYDQCRNLKRNIWVEYKGENKLLMDWLSELNMTRGKYNNIVWKNKKTPQEAFDIHLYMKYNRKKCCYEYKENNNA